MNKELNIPFTIPPIAILHEHWMTQALELAVKANQLDEVPVGAILVHDQKIIGVGHNKREMTGRTTAHAEMMALEDYNERSGEWRVPEGTSLYVTVEPCLMCAGAMLWARLDHIYFGCSDPKKAGIQRILPMIQKGVYDHRFLTVKGGIVSDKCSHLITNYFKKKRQKFTPPATLIT